MHRWAHATPDEKPTGRVSNRHLARRVFGLFRPTAGRCCSRSG